LFELSASEAGTYHLTIDITKLKGEVSYANNRYEVFVQCIKGQQKILLAALAPHPDVSAYRRMIEKNENYSCELVYAPELLKTDVTKYQLCVLHQLPGNLGEATVFIKNAKEHKVPVLYVLGSETNIGLFNQLESTFSIYTNRQSLSEAQASINNEFSLFTLTTEEQASIEKFPPLICPYGTFKMNTPADVFLKQQIGNVITDNPLIAFTSSQGDKTGFIFGEGFWKWALYDAQQAQQHTTENILSKIVQYLSVKSDNRYLRINAKKRYDENEPILIDAELYNPSYELINTPEITIDIEHTSGKKYTYVFSKTEKSYTLQAGVLPTGSYRYTATATIGNKTEKSQGVFYIQPLQLELMQTTANHHLLHQMAHESNGAFADLQHADDLVEKISNNEHSKPVMYTTKEKTPLIELTWLLAFIIALFSVEWFIRKWNGSI
jgi:hypothetical protein